MRRLPGRPSAVLVALAFVVAAAGCGEDTAVSDSTALTSSGTVAPITTVGEAVEDTIVDPIDDPAERGIVVDTDLALDDLVALGVLLSTDADVRAITISGTGEVRCPPGLAVIRGLLEVTGDDRIPVACGRSTPLEGTHEFPSGWRDAADSGWGLTLGSPEAAATDAVTLLGDALAGGGVTLLTLGPLTNVAEALRADPALVDQIDELVMMGGSVDAGGNIEEPGVDADSSEWNVYVDPTAADEVFASGVPIVMVGLDATDSVPVTIDFVERLAANTRTPAAGMVHRLLEQNSLVYNGEAFFWDPLAAAAIIDPSVITTEQMTLDVVTDDGPDSGRTVRADGGTTVDVAVDADRASLESLLIRELNGLDTAGDIVEPPAPVGVATIRLGEGACTYDGPSSVAPGRMRFSFDSDQGGAAAVVAHLTGELTADEVLAWVAANPEPQAQPPGVDVVSAVPAGGAAFLDVVSGMTAMACAAADGSFVLAGTLAVEEMP